MLGKFLKGLFYPLRCILCGKEEEHGLCSFCFKRITEEQSCIRCGMLLGDSGCFRCSRELACDSFRIIAPYEEMHSLIYTCKPEPETAVSYSLNPLLEHWFPSSNMDLVTVPSGSDWLNHMIKPPYWSRVHSPLKKNPGKMSQKLLNREERLQNAMNLFSLSDDCPIRSKSVLLIDDVLTTGASVQACIWLLKQLGYTRIEVLLLSWRS